jgi:hypothetical protein
MGMTERVLGPTGGRRRKRLWLIGPIAALTVFIGLLVASGAVALPAAACATPNVLSGSKFEIDINANMKVDGAAADCIDWKSVTDFNKADKASGTGDDSFGQGTSESEPNPTIVSGSIPPNKSDLSHFGIFKEVAAGKFLELYWTRVQDPNGTTNMDFELNKVACDGTAAKCSNNAPSNKPPLYVTPKRSNGDKLITYDLSKGGTVPTISIRTWGSGAWGAASVISGGASPDALGSVNTSTIPATETADSLGALTAYTFGEVAIDFDVIFGSSVCGSFGSVYLKSRSSDSFTSEVKDFIAPENVTISNCTSMTTLATTSAAPGASISDTASLSGAVSPTGAVTFRLYSDSACASQVGSDIAGSALADPEPDDVWTSTGTYSGAALAPGTYYWRAFFAGDQDNASTSTACGDTGETTTISKINTTMTTNQVLVPNDSATISPGAASTNTVHFYLFKPGTTCSIANANLGTVAVFSQTMSPSAAGAAGPTTNSSNTDSLAGSHANALGTWHWLVVYDGDTTHNGSNDIVNSVCSEAFTITDTATS